LMVLFFGWLMGQGHYLRGGRCLDNHVLLILSNNEFSLSFFWGFLQLFLHLFAFLNSAKVGLDSLVSLVGQLGGLTRLGEGISSERIPSFARLDSSRKAILWHRVRGMHLLAFHRNCCFFSLFSLNLRSNPLNSRSRSVIRVNKIVLLFLLSKLLCEGNLC
jgi:hypothetical protein